MRLNTIYLGFAIGIATALCAFFLGLIGWLFGFWITAIDLLAIFYKGYAPTFFGSVIGAVWGFADGFIGGILVGFFYNKFQSKGGE